MSLSLLRTRPSRRRRSPQAVLRSSRHSGRTSRREVHDPHPGRSAGLPHLVANSTGSDLVYYSLDSVNHVVTITWDDVGYFSQHDNLANAFQLQLIGLGNGDFDIVFRYEAVNWTTGDSSGGSGGLGGTPARAGYSAGDGNPSHYFELPGLRQSANARAGHHERQHGRYRGRHLPGAVRKRDVRADCQRHRAVRRSG